MAKRKVVWTNTADRQLRDILNYWKIRNGSSVYAEKVLKLTNTLIKVILKYPEAYKTTTY